MGDTGLSRAADEQEVRNAKRLFSLLTKIDRHLFSLALFLLQGLYNVLQSFTTIKKLSH